MQRARLGLIAPRLRRRMINIIKRRWRQWWSRLTQQCRRSCAPREPPVGNILLLGWSSSPRFCFFPSPIIVIIICQTSYLHRLVLCKCHCCSRHCHSWSKVGSPEIGHWQYLCDWNNLKWYDIIHNILWCEMIYVTCLKLFNRKLTVLSAAYSPVAIMLIISFRS